MVFSICFTDDDDPQFLQGSISLGEHLETFHASLKDFSRDQYEQQWSNAMRVALTERRPTALFQSVNIRDDGVGTLWLYPIVPSELAVGTDDKILSMSDSPKRDGAGVYLCERFMSVTVKASNFEQRIYEEFEDGSKGAELALYYLDLAAPERYYDYIDYAIGNVSNWYYPNSDLEKILSSE